MKSGLEGDVMTDLSARAFVVRSRLGVGKYLVPADQFAEEFLSGLKDGREILVSARKARSVQHHRYLFALLRRVVENTDGRWADEQVLLEDLKLATGLFETRISALTGMPYPVPASISFASMDQQRFSVWFEKAVQKLAEALGISTEILLGEIEHETRKAA
jgi:hypothetical protein